MLNFIVCEDNENARKIIESIISKSVFKNDYEYKIYTFDNYNLELKKLINSSIGKKIYIIDIELENTSGIDIARDIRKNDWESFIVFSTAHGEMFPQILKDRLMIFDFISKFDNYEENIKEVINDILGIYSNENFLRFNIQKTIYSVRYKDILYLTYDKLERKTEVITMTESYKISKSMKSLSESLPSNFIRINNHCILNKTNIKKINSNGEITFINNTKINEKITKRELMDDVLV